MTFILLGKARISLRVSIFSTFDNLYFRLTWKPSCPLTLPSWTTVRYRTRATLASRSIPQRLLMPQRNFELYTNAFFRAVYQPVRPFQF